MKRWNRELTLKCKLKCSLNPWITHWALALVKGISEPHEVKKKYFDLGGNRTHDLRIRPMWVRFPPRSKDFFFTSCGKVWKLRQNCRHLGSSPTNWGIGASICYDVERRTKAWFDYSQQSGQQQSTRVFFTSKCRRDVSLPAAASEEM